MDKSGCHQELPGFRFHPTEEELLNFYLKNMVFGKKFRGDIIGFLNIYNHDPRELPGLAKIGEREWYFFVPRDRKHGSGGRPNRTTENGFWKATGSDRQILSTSEPKKVLGLKKTLVFYEGRAPRGNKTDWIMNEYRLPDKCSPPKDIVLCKVYRKATSLKMLEHKAAMEEDIKTYTSPSPPTDFISFGNQSDRVYAEDYSMGLYNDNEVKCGEASPSPPTDSISFGNQSDRISSEYYNMGLYNDSMVKCGEFVHEGSTKEKLACSSLVLPSGIQNLGELQLPKYHSDWTQDSFWTQFSPFLPMC